MTRRTRPMRHARTPISSGPSRRLTRRGVTVGAVIGLTLSALPAWAYWTSSASTSTSASSDVLQPPATATATSTSMTGTLIKVTAAPATGPTPTTYRVFRGATQICSTLAVNASTCSEGNLAPNTTYTYSVVSVLQNWLSSGATATVTTPPFPAPTVNGQAAGVGATNDTTPTFAGTAAPSTSVTVRMDGATLGTTTSNASGAWSLSISNSNTISRNVNHSVTARFTNTAGTFDSAALTLLIDTQAPATPTAGFSCTGTTVSGYCKDGTTTVSLSGVTDPATGSGIASLTYSISGGSTGTVTLTGSTGSFSYSTPDGAPSITLTTTDVAGNQTTSTVSAPTAMDNSGPTVTGMSMTNNGNTSGKAETDDTLAVTFVDTASGVNPQSICPTWTTTGTTQSVTGNGVVTVTITESGNNDTLTVTAPTACNGGLAIGSIALGANYVSSTTTYSGSGANSSLVSWTGGTGNRTGTLLITLGTPSQSGNTVSSAAPVYSVTSIKDVVGHPLTNSPYTGSPDRF